MDFIFAGFFVACVIFSFFLHKFFLNKSKKHTLKKANISGIRWGSQSKPVSGGITIYVFFIVGLLFHLFYTEDNPNFENPLVGIAIVVTLSFLMGLSDDIINTSPYFKFFVQILSGIILIRFGIYISIFPYEYFNYLITILWVVGIMNSINMLDNMDAVTTIVSISIFLGLLVNYFLFFSNLDSGIAFILIGTLAAMISFLYFNWSPSKMYMGDNGSQVLGSLLAAISILLVWNNTQSHCVCAIPKQILMVILIFLVPMVDTTTVTINRLLKGKSPFIGGKDHTTHHLVYRGFSEKNVAIFLFIISLISVFLSVYILNFVKKPGITIQILLWVFISVVFLALYINTKVTKQK
ncbi:MAG: undecaprenyl/decaprenyl-phosphate alpha-N-acetylglucosaminyl 1-phosphate transferase [Bacteroidales bacterium]|nr:undecaprenyl/decaprenyl-phosphate alpha-N-acetylglucosaminyl 1-phosphate transferase [Bacteroidales bacterium]